MLAKGSLKFYLHILWVFNRINNVLYVPSPAVKQFVQDEEEAESSTQSIWIEEILLGVTPSPTAPEVYEIFDISSSHIIDPEEDIQISVIEEKLSFHSMQTFSSGSSILNYVHSLPVIV